jgi:hypothetical protein
MKPRTNPKVRRITLTTGTRQFVVQLAFEMIVMGRWVVLGVIDPVHDRDVFFLRRRRDDPPSGRPAGEVLGRTVPVGEVAGRLEHVVDAPGPSRAAWRDPFSRRP